MSCPFGTVPGHEEDAQEPVDDTADRIGGGMVATAVAEAKAAAPALAQATVGVPVEVKRMMEATADMEMAVGGGRSTFAALAELAVIAAAATLGAHAGSGSRGKRVTFQAAERLAAGRAGGVRSGTGVPAGGGKFFKVMDFRTGPKRRAGREGTASQDVNFGGGPT